MQDCGAKNVPMRIEYLCALTYIHLIKKLSPCGFINMGIIMTITERTLLDVSSDKTSSGVSWSAIFAGASGAAALSLILLILGVGLGFSAISPWSNSGISASTFGLSSILWLTFTQIAASGIGGYLAGRLRVKWATVHTDEVYFRDTAHGFLAWAIASLATAALLGSVIGNVLSSGVSASATLVSAAVGSAGVTGTTAAANHTSPMMSSGSTSNSSANDGVLGYMVDSLFRSDQPSAANADSATRLEVGRIFANSIRSNSLPPEDRQYLAQVIAKRTGLPPTDAEKRVSNVFNKAHAAIADAEQRAKQTADSARKAAAYSALWMFIALLSGAFVASLAATFGGRQRDRVIHLGSSST
jgi:hypothetical protein